MTEINTHKLSMLIDRAYNELDKLNDKSNETKLILSRPKVSNMNKRSYVINFREICSKLKRNKDSVKNFFDNELSIKSSVDINGSLVIQGFFKERDIISILQNYVKKYVLCSECSSPNTQFEKNNRILFLYCLKCKSLKAIN